MTTDPPTVDQARAALGEILARPEFAEPEEGFFERFRREALSWILDNVPQARERAENGELCFGTIDCWLIWKLTGGGSHATDASNASRTLLCDLHTGTWSETLLDLFGVPAALMPSIVSGIETVS